MKGSFASIAHSVRASSPSRREHSEGTATVVSALMRQDRTQDARSGVGRHIMIKRTVSALFGLALLAGLGAAPVAAQPSLGMLDALARGLWQVTFRDGEPARRICVRTGREFIRMRHPRGDCNRLVVEDGKNAVTVQYTCRGDGYGRTAIRRESSELVQIDSQGIKGGRPFQFSAEARRVGACN